MEETKRERAERLSEIMAEIQEESMKLILLKIKNGTASSADLKLAMDTAAESGLTLNPDAFPATLKDRLTKNVDAKKFADSDADVISMSRSTG